MKVSSDYGKGSTFYFTVPYQLGTEQKTKLVVDEEKLNTTRTLQILLAEDNEFNQIVAVDTLEEIFPGIQIDLAEIGLIVLEKLEAKEYDLVLMDIQMPEMDGITAEQSIDGKVLFKKNSYRSDNLPCADSSFSSSAKNLNGVITVALHGFPSSSLGGKYVDDFVS